MKIQSGAKQTADILTAENWHCELDIEAQRKVHNWEHFGSTVDGKA